MFTITFGNHLYLIYLKFEAASLCMIAGDYNQSLGLAVPPLQVAT